MEELNSSAPELPEWVTDLIEKAEERGWKKGYDAGKRQMHSDLKNWMEGRHW
jgi:hypothetical protein